MARDQRNTYSVLVAWAKIILPLVALGLLSTVFLFSRQIDPEAAIPFSQSELEQKLREQRLSKPAYSATTEDGASLSISADSAAPNLGGSGGTAENVVARLQQTDGTVIDLSSDTGVLDDDDWLTLSGNVRIDTSNGYHFESEETRSALKRTDISSPGPVSGTGPFGDLQAGRMHLTVPDTGDGIHAIFENGVRLVYKANATGSKEPK